jgi:hypothetical protein
MKTAVALAVSLLLLVAVLPAATVDFISAGPQNNGTDYVGPYSLTVDGIPILGDCISPFQTVAPPYTWQASIIPLPLTVPLLEQAWLDEQYAINSDWVGIQQAVWDLSGTSYSDSDTLGWETAAAVNYSSVDPSEFYLIVPTDQDAQTFLIQVTPEPGTLLLIGCGLFVVGVRRVGSGIR